MAHPGGRPSKYKPEYCEQAHKLVLLGATDERIIDFFGIGNGTFYRWRQAHPEFREALKLSKEEMDTQVEKSLFLRAMGYSHPEDHISNYQGEVTVTPTTKHYPPDATSMIFWLKNRQPDKWRDTQQHNVNVTNLTDIAALMGIAADGSDSE